jgi:ATP-dependent DNA ligase
MSPDNSRQAQTTPKRSPKWRAGNRASWQKIRKTEANAYIRRVFKAFEFCIPTRGMKVPAGAEWFHEIKYDGYRLRVERNGSDHPRRIRLDRLNICGTTLT